MSSFNIHRKKDVRLIEMLGKVDRRSSYNLYIVSCYFTVKGATQFLNKLYDSFSLQKITLYIDKRAALKIGKSKLLKWQKKYENLTLYAVSHADLFHSKAYALVKYDDNDKVERGSLVVGSANLTGNGLSPIKGNIECMLDTQDVSLITEFVHSLDNIYWQGLDKLEEFSGSEDINFRYALLNEGEFAHKWSDNLKSYLSIKFVLSKQGKERTKVDPVFNQNGFKLESLSVSKSYIDFDINRYHSRESKNFIRNYGIECHLGYWVPRDMYAVYFKDHKYKKFKQDFIDYLDSHMDEIVNSIQQDYRTLLDASIIEQLENNPADAFQSKVQELTANDEKLARIYSRLAIFDLPYDISDRKNISDLYEEIGTVSQSRKNKSFVMNVWLDSIETTSIQSFREGIWDE